MPYIWRVSRIEGRIHQAWQIVVEVNMLKRYGLELDDMAVALLIWLCTLPLIGIFIVPFLGWQAGLVAALLMLILSMIVCWGICGWKIFHE